MITYTKARTMFGNLTGDSSTTALVIADDLINDQRRTVLTSKPWWFLEKDFTLTTVAATQSIVLPGDIDRILSDPTVTIGSIQYTPTEVSSRNEWKRINLYPYNSDIPVFWYAYGNNLRFFPIPSTGGYSVNLSAKQRVRDLNIADYSIGTITTTSTVGTTTTITGSGVTWTSGMIGSWIRIDATNAAKGGDGLWYQIASVPSSTTLTLMNPYGGTAISTGSATYVIGQCSILPEAYDSLPIWLALNIYFTSVDPNPEQAQGYLMKATMVQKMMDSDQSNRTGGRVLDDGNDGFRIVNPNLVI